MIGRNQCGVLSTTVAAAGSLWLAVPLASAVGIDAGPPFVFQDNFSVADPGDEPVDAKWNNGGNDTQDRINVITDGTDRLMSVADDTGSDAFIDTDPLNFAGATEWVTEFRIRFGADTTNDDGIIVIGGVFAGNWNDFRIHYGDGDSPGTFDLQWDNAALIGPAADELTRGTFYTVSIHHRTNGQNDLYIGTTLLDQVLAGSRAHLFTSSPSSFLRTGDPGTVGHPFYDYDYIEIGAPTEVPEPASSLAALGALGLLTRRPRRRDRSDVGR